MNTWRVRLLGHGEPRLVDFPDDRFQQILARGTILVQDTRNKQTHIFRITKEDVSPESREAKSVYELSENW